MKRSLLPLFAAVFTAAGVTANAWALEMGVPVRFGVTPSLPSPPGAVSVLVNVEASGTWPLPVLVHCDIIEGDIVVSLREGVDVVVLIPAGDETYVLAGPMRWPAHPERRLVGDPRRRTIVLSGSGVTEPPAWVDGLAQPSSWPVCRPSGPGGWACVGVPADTGGVFVGRLDDAWVAAFVGGQPAGNSPGTVAMRRIGAGALVVVDGLGDEDTCFARAVRPRASVVLAATRYATVEADERVEVETVGGGAFWVSSSEAFAPGASLRVACPGGVAVVDAVSLASAEPAVPVHVALTPVVSQRVLVQGTGGRAAAGAMLDVFAAPARDPAADPLAGKWERVVGVVADDTGVARLERLPRGRYVIRGLHARWGSAVLEVTITGRDLAMQLRPARRLVGRVVRHGIPAAGLPVRVLPALDAIAGTPAALDHVVPPGASDEEGRFEMALPTGAPYELRIGEAPEAVRRIPLPAGVEGDVIDLGIVSLTTPVTVAVSVLLPAACELGAAGPFGRTGLSIVAGVQLAAAEWRLVLPEAGPWLVSGTCGSRDLPLAPAVVDVPAGVSEWGVVLTIRPPQ